MSTLTASDAKGSFEERLLDELLALQAEMISPVTASTSRRRRYRTLAISSVAAAVIALMVLQVLPGTLSKTPSASAAQFLKRAATTVLATATASDQSIVIPQPNQYVYSVNEDPNGTLVKTWISVSGANPGRTEWISGISGDVPATGENSLTPCTLAQAGSCLPEVGYFPSMPTDPSSLLAYLNTIGFVDSSGFADTSSPGYAANDLAKGVMYLLETAYLLPAQRAALFNLMAATPGFTVVPAMADAIGRMGVGVEWTFAGGSGALIFNSTTYDLLGVRTWPPGAPNLNAPYDGNALIGISVVNSTT
jgi:hypothetical protein